MGGVCRVIFSSNRCVEVRLGWGFDNYKSEYEMIDQCPGLIMQIQVVIFIFRFPSKILNFPLAENVTSHVSF